MAPKAPQSSESTSAVVACLWESTPSMRPAAVSVCCSKPLFARCLSLILACFSSIVNRASGRRSSAYSASQRSFSPYASSRAATASSTATRRPRASAAWPLVASRWGAPPSSWSEHDRSACASSAARRASGAPPRDSDRSRSCRGFVADSRATRAPSTASAQTSTHASRAPRSSTSEISPRSGSPRISLEEEPELALCVYSGSSALT